MIRIGKRQNERREQTRADGKAGTHKQTLWRMMRGSSKFFFFVAKTASLLKKEVSSCVFESLERRILIAFGVLNSFLFVLSCLLFMSSRREIDRLLKFVLFFFSRFFDFHTSFFNHLGFLSLTEELKNVKTVFSMVHWKEKNYNTHEIGRSSLPNLWVLHFLLLLPSFVQSSWAMLKIDGARSRFCNTERCGECALEGGVLSSDWRLPIIDPRGLLFLCWILSTFFFSLSLFSERYIWEPNCESAPSQRVQEVSLR